MAFLVSVDLKFEDGQPGQTYYICRDELTPETLLLSVGRIQDEVGAEAVVTFIYEFKERGGLVPA